MAPRPRGCPPNRALAPGADRPAQYTRGRGSPTLADCFQVTTTLPDEAAAQQVGARLVEERLAACAQVVGPVSSTYRWKGKVELAVEWYCNLKTTKTRLSALKQRIRELHPYEVPEIVAIRIQDGDGDYLKWIETEVEARKPGRFR